MGFLKLIQLAGRDPLPIPDIVRRLQEEFDYVVADPEAGQDDVANIIAATLRLSRVWEGGEERVAALQAIQQEAVYVWFGDDSSLTAECCLKPGWALYFGRDAEVDGPARPLVERARIALGYVVHDE